MTRHANSKTLSLTLAKACAVASLAVALASAASARDDAADGAGVARVPYGDLNLASPAGERALNARVWAAARSLCRPNALLTDIVTRICIRNTFRAARPQILSAIAAAREPSLAASRNR